MINIQKSFNNKTVRIKSLEKILEIKNNQINITLLSIENLKMKKLQLQSKITYFNEEIDKTYKEYMKFNDFCENNINYIKNIKLKILNIKKEIDSIYNEISDLKEDLALQFREAKSTEKLLEKLTLKQNNELEKNNQKLLEESQSIIYNKLN